MRRFVILAMFCYANPILAETITIEADDGADFIRCVDMFGIASCEMIFESVDKYYNCIAIDATGSPIATGVGSGSSVLFQDLDHTRVADVKCRSE
jgi:hypothetical protein